MERIRFMHYLFVLMGMLILAGCDDKKNAQVAGATPSATEQAHTPLRLDAEQRDKLRQQYIGKPLTLLDASEIQLDGASTLALTFSLPLNPDQAFRSHIKVIDETQGAVDGAWTLSPNLKVLYLRYLEPGRKLSVFVDEGLLAINDARLGQSEQKEITTRASHPTVGFASKGSLLPSDLLAGLPVMALNVSQVDVNFYRIKNDSLSQFIPQWSYRNSLSNWESDDLLNNADLVYTGRFALDVKRNTREKLILPLADIAPLQKPGVYLAIMSRAGQYDYTNPATLFTLSDIGLAAHHYQGRIDIFNQSLENGEAKSGVELTLLNDKGQSIGQTRSDKRGHASFEKADAARFIVARQGAQTTLLDMALPALELAEFNIAGEAYHPTQFFMFGPRDLYRPGETVVLNGLMRDADGKPLPARPVKLEVVKPDGKVSHTQVWQPNDGLYQYRYALGDNASTGRWEMRINTGDNQPRVWSFQVEDFMPERMALEIDSDKTPRAPDDNGYFSITGRYLYGAPAAGNHLQGQLFLRPLREAVASLPGFQFGDVNEKNLTRDLDEIDLTLDDQGQAEISAESEWREARSPLRLVLQASVLESGGRPVTRRAEQSIWPASLLPGIRAQFASKEIYDYRTDTTQKRPMVDEDSLAGFDIVYADSQGNKSAVNGLMVKLIRERRDYYWSFNEGDGWSSQYDQKDLLEAEQTLSLKENETARVAFPVEWGAYRLEVSSPDNQAVSSVRFWAGYSWQDNSDKAGAIRPDRVTIKLDKPAYRAGDIAQVTLAAPSAGKGYALVESGEGPLWWQEITVPAEGMSLSIPIDKRWQRHDLYLTTVVIRPGDKSQSATPKRAVGILHLPLADDSRRLTLGVQTPQKMRPNQEMTIKVKADVAGGQRPDQIHVLLSAVDVGVLNITDYKTPDPWQGFLGPKRYGADIYDIYGQVIEGSGRLASLRFGGSGDDGDALSRGGKKPVNHVTIIAEQAQPVTLDANGEGTVTLPIGDFNGELRVMAQAWSDDKFGQGEASTTVAAPLITELAGPRFMGSGDKTRLAVDVTNLTDTPQELNAHFSTGGLLSLDGQGAYALRLDAGMRKTLYIPVRALDGFGDGQLNMTIDGLQLADEKSSAFEKSWKLGVRPVLPASTVNYGTMLKPGEVWTLPPELISGLVPATLEGQLLLSGRPPLNLARYIRELNAYPYGCLEQTVSGLFPSLYSNEAILRDLGIKGHTDIQRRAAIETGIARLFEMQNNHGGFGLWDKSGPEEYWLTAYVTDFLVRAAEQGYAVNAGALNLANKRLLRYLQDPGLINVRYSEENTASRYAVQAYAGFVLARQQKAPLGALRELWLRHNQAQSGLPLAQLGIALKLMGDEARGMQALQLGINTSRPHQPGWIGDYGSPLRDNAAKLSLLEEYSLLPEQQSNLLLALSELAWGERWLSTQETNSLFLAGRYQLNNPGEWQVESSLQQGSQSASQPLTRNLTAGELSDLRISNTGETPLYLRLDSSGYPQSMPEPHSNVLNIERQYLDTQGNRRPLSTLKSGELVVVKLNVRANRNVPDALVVDLLPAGLELENQSLDNSSALLSDGADAIQVLLAQMQQQDIQHIEYRDDRFVAALALFAGRPATLVYLARAVTPGEYSVPMPLVESMYVPQWRATGATPQQLSVVP